MFPCAKLENRTVDKGDRIMDHLKTKSCLSCRCRPLLTISEQKKHACLWHAPGWGRAALEELIGDDKERKKCRLN